MKPDEDGKITIPEDGTYWVGMNVGNPTRLDYAQMRRAWFKGTTEKPEQPIIMRPEEVAELERIGIVKDGRIDMAALNAYRRDHDI